MITRRGLFGLLPALGAIGLPAEQPKAKEVEPIIFEHTCTGNWDLYTDEERAEFIRDGSSEWRRGCGTTFQWHFGVPPYCPKCGYAYESTLKMIATGRYRIVQGVMPKPEA